MVSRGYWFGSSWQEAELQQLRYSDRHRGRRVLPAWHGFGNGASIGTGAEVSHEVLVLAATDAEKLDWVAQAAVLGRVCQAPEEHRS